MIDSAKIEQLNGNAAGHCVRWQSYWHGALHGIKRAILGRRRIRIADANYIVAYEARRFHSDPDLLVLSHFARGRSCVLDVGANVGITTLVMASELAEAGCLFSFDASEASCLIVRENVLINGLAEKVTVVNALLGARSGLPIRFNWNFVAGNASTVIQAPSKTPTIPLIKPALAIDDFIVQKSLKPDLIKIDVEGGEHDVLLGTQQTLKQFRPLVFVEVHSWPGVTLRDNCQRINDLLEPMDYQLLLRTPSGEHVAFCESSELIDKTQPAWNRCWAAVLHSSHDNYRKLLQ